MLFSPRLRGERRRSIFHSVLIRVRWLLRYLRLEEIRRRRREREVRDWMPNCYYLDY